MTRKGAQRGFTLIEVLIAVAILGLGLGVLMHATAASLAAAGRTRGLTIATLLARSKMADVEQRIMDEGFSVGDVEDEGDFGDDGHPEVTWKSKVMEVQLDLSMLDKLGGGGEDEKGGGGAASLASSLGAPLEGFSKSVADAMRVVELTITYPSDAIHHDTMVVRSVVTRDDLQNPFQAQQAAAAASLLPGGGGVGGAGGGGGGTTSPPPRGVP